MLLEYNFYILLPLVALFISLALVVRAWRYRTKHIALTFILMMASLIVWSFTVVMEHTSLELANKFFWLKMSYLGIVTLPVVWVSFTLEYTGREKWLTRRNIILLSFIPAVTLALVFTNEYHFLIWGNIWLDNSVMPPVDAVTHGAWFWMNAVYAYALILSGTLSLISLFRRSTGIYRKQAGVMLVATFIPWLANCLYLSGAMPFTVVDPTPIAFAITGIGFFWGLTRLQLLDVMPIAYEVIFRNMTDGVIVLDTRERIIELNPAAQSIIGRPHREIIGQPFKSVFPGEAGLFENRPVDTGTGHHLTLGGGEAPRYYAVAVSPIATDGRPTGHLVILHDETERTRAEAAARDKAVLTTELTERKRAAENIQRRLDIEEAIARISARFVCPTDIGQAIIDSLADVGRLSSASRAILMFRPEEKIAPEPVYEWCADGVGSQKRILKNIRPESFPWWVAAISRGEAIRINDLAELPLEAAAERHLLAAFGTRSLLVIPLFLGEKPVGFFDIVNTQSDGAWSESDLAILRLSSEIIMSALERRLAEERLSEVNAELMSLNTQLEARVAERTGQLAEAVAEARASNQAKSQFLANMSHELRTPLNAILGFSQMLKELYFGPLNGKQAEYVTDILESGEHLLSLINDVLDLSKIEAGKMEMEFGRVRVREVLERSLVMIKEKALSHRICLTLSVTGAVESLEITADERLLKQILYNLLSNAAKFTPDGGEITLAAGVADGELVVSVADTGIGMSAESQKRLFEAFYQVNGGMRDKTPGTGLGLSITRKIVEKHGGRIRAESEGLNKGSRFTFTIPVDLPAGREKALAGAAETIA